jgi:TetR/AcrR family transcriptional regulator, tetracycline repressor protein
MPRRRVAPRTQTEVVDAALAVVDEAGLDGLTIRGVAAASGIPTMTLYAFFQGKEELLELMATRAAEHLFASARRTTWQASVEGLCHHARATVLAHPSWLPLLARRALPRAPAVREDVVELMLGAGYSERAAASVVLEASLLALGLAQLQLSFVPARCALPPQGALPAAGIEWDGTFAATVARWIAGVEAEGSLAAKRPQSASTSTASSALEDSRIQSSSDAVAAMAVTVPRVEVTSLGSPPERGNARMPPGCEQ